jgi:CcmD family protein
MIAATLPEHSNDGYVAAAYIVFFALILIYVSIMALRLSRTERRLRELEAQREAQAAEPALAAERGATPGGDSSTDRPADGHTRASERLETV